MDYVGFTTLILNYMERFISEYEPRVNTLFSDINLEEINLVGYLSDIAMDFLEDLYSNDNQLSPRELLKSEKYHCLMRLLKEAKVFASFTSLASECWDKKQAKSQNTTKI